MMDKIKSFLKKTKISTRILFVLWLASSFCINYENETRLQIIFEQFCVFIVPAVVIELRKNPFLDSSNLFIITFLRKTRLVSRVLTYLWMITSLMIISGSPHDLSLVKDSLIFGTFMFMLPTVLIEFISAYKRNQENEQDIISTNVSVREAKFKEYEKAKEEKRIVQQQQKSARKAQREYEKQKKAEHKEAKRAAYQAQLAEQQRKKLCEGIHLSEKQIQDLETKANLPIVKTPVFLSSGEIAVYHCVATRQETKKRVIGRTGGYSGGTVRIAKGFSIHTGGSTSQPIYGDVSTQYPGELVITNKRVIFLATQKGFELKHTNILAASLYSDGFTLQSKSKTYELIVPYPSLALIAFDGVRTGDIPFGESVTNENYHADSKDELVTQYLKAGKKIQAVKELRDLYGYGLAEAKSLADQLESELHYQSVSGVDESSDPNLVIRNSTLIFDIDGMDGHEFEYYCANILRKVGFTKVNVTKGSGDQGVDILAEKEGIKYAIQCKNYSSPLSNTPIQEVNAGKAFYSCHVGVVMTNSTFTTSAIDLANATGVLLWDRDILKSMIQKAN